MICWCWWLTTLHLSARRFYGGTPELKAAYSMRPGAEADDSYGVIQFGSCGFTHSDGTLAYPQDMYAALAGKWLPEQMDNTELPQSGSVSQ